MSSSDLVEAKGRRRSKKDQTSVTNDISNNSPLLNQEKNNILSENESTNMFYIQNHVYNNINSHEWPSLGSSIFSSTIPQQPSQGNPLINFEASPNISNFLQIESAAQMHQIPSQVPNEIVEGKGMNSSSSSIDFCGLESNTVQIASASSSFELDLQNRNQIAGSKISSRSKKSKSLAQKKSKNSRTFVKLEDESNNSHRFYAISTTEEMLKLPDLFQSIFNAGDAATMYDTFRGKSLEKFYVQSYCYDPKGQKDYSNGIRYHYGWTNYRTYLEELFKFVPDGVAITMNARIDDSREDCIIVLCDYVYTGNYLMLDTTSRSSSLVSSTENDETWSTKSWQLSDYQYACLSILGQFTTVEETMHLKGLHHVPTHGTHTFRIDSNGVFSIFIDRQSRLISMFEFKYYVDDHSSSLEG